MSEQSNLTLDDKLGSLFKEAASCSDLYRYNQILTETIELLQKDPSTTATAVRDRHPLEGKEDLKNEVGMIVRNKNKYEIKSNFFLDQLSSNLTGCKKLAIDALIYGSLDASTLLLHLTTTIAQKPADLAVRALERVMQCFSSEKAARTYLTELVTKKDAQIEVRIRAVELLQRVYEPMLETSLGRILVDEDVDDLLVKTVLKLLRGRASVKSFVPVLRVLARNNDALTPTALSVLDDLYPQVRDTSNPFIKKGMSDREQRQLANLFESRNFQQVYPNVFCHLLGSELSAPEFNGHELGKYGRIYNFVHERQNLSYCYGRDALVDDLFSSLLEGNRQSLLFVGDHGVGKTSLIHQLSRKLIDYSDTEDDMKKRWIILEASTTSLMTETRYLGEWETKMSKMTDEIKRSVAQVILYITNINGFVGAGRHSSSDENFCDFFHPILSRREIIVIGETTAAQLNRGLGAESSFTRLFKQIKLHPATSSETSHILNSLIEHNTLEATLNTSVPRMSDPSIGTPGLRKDQLFLRKTRGDYRLFRYDTSGSDENINRIVQFATSFNVDRELPGSACDLLNEVALHDLKQLQISNPELLEIPKDPTTGAPLPPKNDSVHEIPLSITSIIDTCTSLTGYPLEIVDPTKRFDLEATRTWFKERLVGQDGAIEEIINRFAMMKTNMTAPNRPLAVYFLVGPTGVGKTFFAKLVAEFIFGDRERMNRIDLSEYSGGLAAERLMGHTYGGVGRYANSGSLTDLMKKQPFCVLLLDEFEKAADEVHNLFLQVFDEARATNQRGDQLNFSQCIILITSNVGCSRASTKSVGFRGEEVVKSELESRVRKNMEKHFAPELINRLDKVIFFNPLNEDAINKLIDFELANIHKRVGIYSNEICIDLSPEARNWIAKNGFSETYGARHLLRCMEQSVLAPISKLMASTELPEIDKRIVYITCRKRDRSHNEELQAEWLIDHEKNASSPSTPSSPADSTPPANS